ncbi:MAG: hypothetical protein AAFX94_10650 [Myxococcota bacterium]
MARARYGEPVVIKKSATPRGLPAIHPGLQQKIREAEDAERSGRTPRRMLADLQKILRPTLDAREAIRKAQARTIGLIEPVYRAEADGLLEIADMPAFRPGADLDALWDNLSEQEKIRAGATERFRLELEATLKRAAKPWNPPHVIARTLNGRALRHLAENARSYASAFDDLIAPDAYALLLRFIDETEELVRIAIRADKLSGVAGNEMAELLQDLTQKLVYQELISRRRAMGDRGIRRICANIELAERIYTPLVAARKATLRDRLLMRVIHVHQDLGHTAYAARMSYRGGKLHRAYGARIFTDEMNRYRPLLTGPELTLARAAVATHADPTLPFSETLVLGLVRAVDHLAPFAPHRAFLQIREVPAIDEFLDDLVDRVNRGDRDQFVAAKNAFGQYLAYESKLSPVLLEDVLAGFRPFERMADPLDLGRGAGTVDTLELNSSGAGTLTVTVAHDPFIERYQVLFDSQQEQFMRLIRQSGARFDPQSPDLDLGTDEGGTLALRFQN